MILHVLVLQARVHVHVDTVSGDKGILSERLCVCVEGLEGEGLMTCMMSFPPPLCVYSHFIILAMCVHNHLLPLPPLLLPPPQPTQIEEVELKADGGEIEVTDRNKKMFCWCFTIRESAKMPVRLQSKSAWLRTQMSL